MNFFYSAHFVALLVVSCHGKPDGDIIANKPKCLDTSRHKSSPSSEANLYKMCNVHGEMSCCTNDTAVRIHDGDLYNWSKLLCKNKDLSPECKKFFLKDACFYECSPHLGRWINVDNGREYLRNVPLCKSDCDNWFAACANDFTCSKNWKVDHENPEFTCKVGDKCQTIKDKFQKAEDFCEKVWDKSYDVVEGEGCLKVDIASKKDTRNNESVAKDDKNSGSAVTYNIIVLSLPLLAYFNTFTSSSQ